MTHSKQLDCNCVVNYPYHGSYNVIICSIPLAMLLFSLYGNGTIYLGVRFLLHTQNEVVNSIAKDKIMKRIVWLIPLLHSGRVYIYYQYLYVVFLV